MKVWACPACGREFGKTGQSHVCAPAISVDAYFAGRKPVEREIFEAVREHLDGLGPLIVEPVGVGILFKRRRTFAELRPMKRWQALSFGLMRRAEHERITRTTRTKSLETYHAVRVTHASEIDRVIRGWLTEAYFEYGV